MVDKEHIESTSRLRIRKISAFVFFITSPANARSQCNRIADVVCAVNKAGNRITRQIPINELHDLLIKTERGHWGRCHPGISARVSRQKDLEDTVDRLFKVINARKPLKLAVTGRCQAKFMRYRFGFRRFNDRTGSGDAIRYDRGTVVIICVLAFV